MNVIRDPAHLQVGKTYTFTRAINGYSYKMTFTGTNQSRRPTQEAQYIGNNNPLETVYAFDCEGTKSPQWVWSHDVINGVYTDGHWTE